MAEPAAAAVKGRLLTLQESVRQLSHSANQLLSLARTDPAVNVAARNQPVSLGQLVGEVVARFFDRALQLNIDLGVELAPAVVLADPALLDDLLSNLLDNALKYTPNGGRVTVSAGQQGSRPMLAVEDKSETGTADAAANPASPNPELWKVRAKLEFDFTPPGLMNLLKQITMNPQQVVVESLNIRKEPVPRVDMLLVANFQKTAKK